MALDTGMKCIKYLLFIFNLLFVVSGSAIIVVGAVIEAKYGDYLGFMSSYLSAPSLLVGVGVLVFCVGFFGCCGAIKENHCMVVTFVVLLVVIFVIEIVVAVASYIMRSEVEDFLRRNMQKSMTTYNVSSNQGVYRTWNVIQHDNACCGTDGFRDWEETQFGRWADGVPDDCCKETIEGCGRNMFTDYVDLELINKEGCFDKLKGDVEENFTILGGVALGIGCVQLVGVAFASCLAKSLKRQCETV